jgi:hypothetical protein
MMELLLPAAMPMLALRAPDAQTSFLKDPSADRRASLHARRADANSSRLPGKERNILFRIRLLAPGYMPKRRVRNPEPGTKGKRPHLVLKSFRGVMLEDLKTSTAPIQETKPNSPLAFSLTDVSR